MTIKNKFFQISVQPNTQELTRVLGKKYQLTQDSFGFDIQLECGKQEITATIWKPKAREGNSN